MSDSNVHLYALSLGSNRALSARRTPARLLDEAIAMIAQAGAVHAVSQTITTAPIGPSRRRFANAALLVKTILPPPVMLARLQDMEQALGRRRYRRWGARSVDIDIILWSGGIWNSRLLTLPHAAFRQRSFVLAPMLTIAAHWRDPRSGLTVRHLSARVKKGKAIDTARG